MWLTGGIGIALEKENEVGHTMRGRGKRSGREGKGERVSAKTSTAHLLVSHVIQAFFLNRISIWKWFKGQQLVVFQHDKGSRGLDGDISITF